MARPLAVVLAFSMLSGCGGDASGAEGDDPAVERPTTPTDASLPTADVRPGASLDRILVERPDDGAFLDALRPPRVRLTEPVENRYVEGQVDSVVTLVYDGLGIEAYEVTGGRTFVRRLAVTDGSYGTDSGLSVGEARDDLEAVLGPPVAVAGDIVTYQDAETVAEPEPPRVEITYEPDLDGVERATQIVWIPYLD